MKKNVGHKKRFKKIEKKNDEKRWQKRNIKISPARRKFYVRVKGEKQSWRKRAKEKITETKKKKANEKKANPGSILTAGTRSGLEKSAYCREILNFQS